MCSPSQRLGGDGAVSAEAAMRRSSGRPDRNAARASLLTGAYIAAAGLALLFAPLKTFGMLFSTSTIAKGWIQVFGVLCCAFGCYYIGAGRRDADGLRAFYQSTVVGRLGIFMAFGVLVARGAVESGLLLLGLVNAAGAALMWSALAKDEEAAQGGARVA